MSAEKDKIYGVGIQGAGWVSTQHIDAYKANPHTRVVAICSRRMSSCKARAEEASLKDVRLYTDYDRMLDDPEVDIVSICTPQHLHPEETVKAAEARKHILIEKPVAISLEGLKAMRDAVRKAGVKTVVSFVLRWNPLVKILKRIISEGFIGDVYHIETAYQHNLGDWWTGWKYAKTKEQGVSALLVGGCHAIDMSRWLACRDINGTVNIREVYAYSGGLRRKKRIPGDIEYDAFETMLVRYENDAIGNISADFECIQPYTFPIIVFGDEGTIRDNRIWSKKFEGQTGWIEIPTILPDSGEVTHHPFRDEIDHFVDCILSDRESHCNLEDAVNTHEAALAAIISEREKTPITLPLIK
jgi:predicted dehydrogenase